MMEAGNLVKAQQYAAYSGFEKVSAEIANCTTAEQFKTIFANRKRINTAFITIVCDENHHTQITYVLTAY